MFGFIVFAVLPVVAVAGIAAGRMRWRKEISQSAALAAVRV